LKLDVKLRDKSEAQKIALEAGRSEHPTEGRKMTEEHRRAQGASISAAYENASQEEKERRSKLAQERYFNKPEEERAALRRKASTGVLEAAVKGSKLERFLLDKLSNLGYSVVFHKKGYILNENLEIDLLIPSLKIAIEVDGVFHMEDVWHNGSLERTKKKDNEKNGLLLGAGYVVIRLSNTAKSCSKYYMRERLSVLVECLEKVKNNFPELKDRLIYLGE